MIGVSSVRSQTRARRLHDPRKRRTRTAQDQTEVFHDTIIGGTEPKSKKKGLVWDSKPAGLFLREARASREQGSFVKPARTAE
jgi:hypothetical protein